MWWDGHMGWWPSWISGLMMAAFWVLIVVGIILLVRSLSGSRPQGPPASGPPPGQPPYGPPGPPPTTPSGPYAQAPSGPPGPHPTRTGDPREQALAILRERYARGEIDREEYLQKKADLEG